MRLTIHTDAVPLRVEENGDVRVGKTRVLLDMVVYAFNDGATPETIMQSFDTLDLADVYAVCAYYLRHREDVDAYLRWREAEGEKTRRMIEAAQGDMAGLRERLLARRKEWDERHATPAQ